MARSPAVASVVLANVPEDVQAAVVPPFERVSFR